MIKEEYHITNLPLESDPELCIALGEMVIAYGRLEDMFKIAIKRIERKETLAEVIKRFQKHTLGNLMQYCRDHKFVPEFYSEADRLNEFRRNFIHATFAEDDKGNYVRFRKLLGYTTLKADIADIRSATADVNTLIKNIDGATGAPHKNEDSSVIAIVSAV